MVLPFMMQPATVKVHIQDRNTDPVTMMIQNQGPEDVKRILRDINGGKKQ